MAWTTTNFLNIGPLTNDSYDFTITDLVPSAKYRYRSYFIVDGVEYYGNVLTGQTAAIELSNPILITGNAQFATASTVYVPNNTINNDGNTEIIEYGILYTQFSAYGTNTNLIYENYPTHMNKVSICSSVPVLPYNYNNTISGLTSSTNTFYRAFARNAHGVGYGTIETKVTTS